MSTFGREKTARPPPRDMLTIPKTRYVFSEGKDDHLSILILGKSSGKIRTIHPNRINTVPNAKPHRRSSDLLFHALIPLFYSIAA